MCDHQHDRRPRREDGGRDFRDGPQREDRRYWEEREARDRRFEVEQDLDPVDTLKESLFDMTEEAFQELMYDKVKDLLEAKLGDRLDSIAELVVDQFIRQRERETDEILEESAFDTQFRQTLKKK